MATFWQNLNNLFKGRKGRIAGGAVLAVIIVMLILLVLPIIGGVDVTGNLSAGAATVGGGWSIPPGVYQ